MLMLVLSTFLSLVFAESIVFNDTVVLPIMFRMD